MKNSKEQHIGRRIITSILGCIIGGVLIGAYIIVRIVAQVPDINQIRFQAEEPYTTIVYDEEGNRIINFSQSEDRAYISLSQIPITMQQAIIFMEDKEFYKHRGIDFFNSIGRLIKHLISGHGLYHGSTITQQVIECNVALNHHTIADKLQEQYLALKLERYYGKDIILENYLNTISFGGRALGVEAAAEYYFDKHINELALGEQLVLAVMIKNPTYYSPIHNPKNNWEKVRSVMEEMVSSGYLKEEDRQLVLKSNPYQNIRKTWGNKNDRTLIAKVYNEVVHILQAKLNLSKIEAQQILYSEKLRIYTNLDRRLLGSDTSKLQIKIEDSKGNVIWE